MYHVIDPGERLGVLHELKRILKPHSPTVIAYLNAWGLLRAGIVNFPHWYNDIATLRAMLHERTFSGLALANFTECYWRRRTQHCGMSVSEVADPGFHTARPPAPRRWAGVLAQASCLM